MTKIVEETIEFIGSLGYKESDILWVGSYDGKFAMSWEEFSDKFKNLAYDNGYGCQEIAVDLVVVGEDWWLERQEYDGAEHWEYKKYPKAITRLSFDKITGSWGTLESIMAEEGETYE